MSAHDEHEYLALAAVADQVNDALAAGQTPDVEAMVAEHPGLEDSIRQLVPALAALQELAPAGVTETHLDVLQDQTRGILGDFRILREVGRGGMGVVYEAEQVSLGRKVALKVLPFANVLDKRHLQRFQIEAQAAARLHHGNIVPVYGVGEERGVPYYSMQFVEGHTLADVIAELGSNDEKPASNATQAILLDRSGDATGAGARSSAETLSSGASTRSRSFFRAVARVGIQAAEALDHAHTMGVIHRDVKPSNLLVDGGGQVWVTDFGLARLAGDPGMTMSGDLLGTLRYMSPEQSAATRAPVDFHTDIYSLGATLYELLTLRPAMEGSDRRTLLQKIGQEELQPMRRWNPATPAELQMIVQKAMAKDPSDRYTSAGELATDLRRFLDDEPIQARPPTLMQQARKWMHRHQGVVTSALAVLVVTAAALSASSLLIWRAKTRTEAALHNAEQARIEAEFNFRRARRAVNDLLTKPAEGAFVFMPGHVPLGRELLEEAIRHYETFLSERDEPEVRGELARLYQSLSNVLCNLGQHEDALRASASEIRLLEDNVRVPNSNPVMRRRLAGALSTRARTLTIVRRLEEAEQVFREARAYYDAFLAGHPEDPDGQIGLGALHSRYGRMLRIDGRLAEAVREDRRAVALGEAACALRDDELSRHAVAHWRNNLGAHLNDLGKAAEAVSEYEKASEYFADAVTRFPENPTLKSNRALAHYNLGGPLGRLGRSREAERHFRTAIRLYRELRSDFPSVPEYAYDWARSSIGLATLLSRHGRRKGEARARLETAGRELEKLVARCPGVPAYRHDLSVVYMRRHGFLAADGRPAEAEAALRRAIDELSDGSTDASTSRPQQDNLAHVHLVLAGFLHGAGRLPEAENAARHAIALFGQCGTESTLSHKGRRNLAAGHNLLGLIRQGQELHAEAEAFYRKGIAVLARLQAAVQDPQRYHSLHAMLLSNLGSSLESQERFREAIVELEKALATMPTHSDATLNLAWCLVAVPESELRDAARAEKLARDMVRKDPNKLNGWNTLAVALFRCGKDKQAIRALRRAADLEGPRTLYRDFVLAMVRWRLGEPEQAGAVYDEAIRTLRNSKAVRPYLTAVAQEAAALLGRRDAGRKERTP